MFTSLTSKLFGGLSVVLALTFIAMLLGKNYEISKLEKALAASRDTNTSLRLDNASLLINQTELEKGVAACSNSIAVAAAKASAAAAAGEAALAEARKGSAAVAATVRSIQGMPSATCADAEAILRAGARP